MNNITTWLEKRCPVCGRTFEYVKDGYEPKTCDSFDCAHKYVHHPEKYGGKK